MGDVAGNEGVNMHYHIYGAWKYCYWNGLHRVCVCGKVQHSVQDSAILIHVRTRG